MTCLCLNDDSYLVAHIGDSRIYHVRPSLYNPETGRGGILYQSSDHSLVNDLLKAGELTEEEARDFPQKNIITRAMQPHLAKRFNADVYQFDDIQSGDYFFLCCDGVLEQLSNADLCRIVADKNLNDSQKLGKIKEICDGKTRDNYTCWLVPIDKVKINSKGVNSSIIQAEVQEVEETEVAESEEIVAEKQESLVPEAKKVAPKKQKTISIKIPVPSVSRKAVRWVIIGIVALAVVSGIVYAGYKVFWSKPETEKVENIKQKSQNIKKKANKDAQKQQTDEKE